ncbi:MAG: hypothetical protein A6F70_05120 [Cycloclasticus sp. symbiont of Bathymodiolus heckerae]|nr:MAG: hypothetical protein A6F70_05120 [Cycloclasticus sp. symbiont of Bathymodiolus heckerae]
MSRQRRNRNKGLSLYIWHRYAGLFASLFVIFISITGIALNHTDDLELKKQHISTDFLLSLYNVQDPSVIIRFKTPQHTISQADDMLFINTSPPLSIDSTLTGAIKHADFTIIALTNKLLLIDADSQLIETLDGLDGAPNNISHIGLDEQQRVNVLANNAIYLLTNDLVLAPIAFNYNINWVKSATVSTADKNDISMQYRSEIISLETLMLDIHSGRFFGAYGTLFFDIVGGILLFLAFTGVIIWLRQRPKKSS